MSEGLFEKYTVIDNETGKKVEHFTFTLSPEKDSAAVAALLAYIEATPNRELASDLESSLETMLLMGWATPPKECDYCGEFRGQLKGSPYMADLGEGAEMCKPCWDMTRKEYKGATDEDIGEF